jgi:hypothetical protein
MLHLCYAGSSSVAHLLPFLFPSFIRASGCSATVASAYLLRCYAQNPTPGIFDLILSRARLCCKCMEGKICRVEEERNRNSRHLQSTKEIRVVQSNEDWGDHKSIKCKEKIPWIKINMAHTPSVTKYLSLYALRETTLIKYILKILIFMIYN